MGKENIDEIVKMVPEKYKMMLYPLINRFNCLDFIMDNRSDYERTIEVTLVASRYITKYVKFSDRYRGECLQQIIRKTFYDTLLIIENDFNQDKFNYFIVLRSNNVITEEKWANNTPGDQAFLHRAAQMMVENGKLDVCFTIDGRRYSRGQNGKLIVN
jgi:hypothetical protein